MSVSKIAEFFICQKHYFDTYIYCAKYVNQPLLRDETKIQLLGIQLSSETRFNVSFVGFSIENDNQVERERNILSSIVSLH